MHGLKLEVKSPRMDNVAFLSGVIEGFYGRPWLQHQRLLLFKQMSAWKLNTFLYAPKDDLKHRSLWRELYSTEEKRQITELVEGCATHGVRFVYAIAPGLDMTYSSDHEFQLLLCKLKQVFDLGVRSFSLLFDDIPEKLCEGDSKMFPSFAWAHCSVAQKVLDATKVWVQQEKANEKTSSHRGVTSKLITPVLFFCPTPYCAAMATPSLLECEYLQTVGSELPSDYHILWTGPTIVSEDITVEHVAEVASVIKRKPLIWDNLHANDYDLRRIYLGPVEGRCSELKQHISGILSNPNCEFAANFIPLRTLSIYVSTQNYVTKKALECAIKEWIPVFDGYDGSALGEATMSETLTQEDVKLLVDMLYLPHKQGPTSEKMLLSFRTMIAKRPSDWPSGILDEFLHTAKEMQGVYEKVTRIKNRDLCYSLYKFLWEIKEELILSQAYVTWVRNGCVGGAFSSHEHSPGTYRGGFVAALQKFVPACASGVFPAPPYMRTISPAPNCFIRPFCPNDKKSFYLVCLKTGDSGWDASHLYPRDPDALGRRWVGPYLELQPQFAFALEDEQGVCGYTLGALNTSSFYEDMMKTYIPSVCAHIPNPEGEFANLSPEGKLAREFHTFQPMDHFPDELHQYPSHLHIDILPRAQGRGFGTIMIRAVCSALAAAGSTGVHLEMSIKNDRALRFYKKLGFKELLRREEEDALFLGKAL